MLQISGVEDERREIESRMTVEWKISDILTLSEDSDYFCQSPVFSFANADWVLQVFPKGDNISNETESWISVYLRRQCVVHANITLYFTLGMKKVDGNKVKILYKNHTFDKKNYRCGLQKFYKRSELLRRKTELLPSDGITFTCTLEHNNVTVIEAADHSMKLIELETLSTNFKDLFTSKRNCDATLKVKDKEFQVHQSILIARSSVFGRMFEHDMSEKETGVVSIDDCDPDSFGEFLQYLYIGKVENISSRSALYLYSTADKYDVKELKSFCVSFMMKNLTVENVCDVVTLGEQYDEVELLSAAQIFFNKNVSRIFSTVKWETLLKENYRLANKLLKEMATKVKIEAIHISDEEKMGKEARISAECGRDSYFIEGASIAPDLETQNNAIVNISKKVLQQVDVWCFIDKKWFNQWREYVGTQLMFVILQLILVLLIILRF